MPTQIIPTDVRITGALTVEGGFTPTTGSIQNNSMAANADMERTKMGQNVLDPFPVVLTRLRVFDALHTNLPSAGASDDLGLVGGTFGTNSPMVKTSDAKATTITQRARYIDFVPENYDPGETINLRLHAIMQTTISDTTATVDVEVYAIDQEGGIGSDLCTTAATSINSLTGADYDFVITGTGLTPSDELDVRITIAITDGATGTAVTGAIGSIALLCDTRG